MVRILPPLAFLALFLVSAPQAAPGLALGAEPIPVLWDNQRQSVRSPVAASRADPVHRQHSRNCKGRRR